MNLITKQKQTYDYIENKLMITKGERGGINQEFGVSRYKLSYIKQTNKNVLRYSTRNYIQQFVITYNGKEFQKVCVCIYTCVCVTAVHQQLTQHCKSAIFQLDKHMHKQGLRELPHHAVLKVKVWLPCATMADLSNCPKAL